MSKSFLFKSLLSGFLLGILIFTFYPKLILVILFFILLLFSKFFKYKLLSFILLGIFLAGSRIVFFQHQITNENIDYFVDQEVILGGYILKEPVLKDKKYQYILGDLKLNGEEKKGLIQFQYWQYPKYQYGDHLTLSGFLELPPVLDDFDYKAYLNMKGIFALLQQVKIIDYKVSSLNAYNLIFKFKDKLDKQVKSLFPEPHASFLNGLLFGIRTGLPKEVSENFRITGLTHIIAISGYNITLIIVIVLTLLGFLPRKLRLIIAGVFIVVFTILVGAEAAVVRAALMGVISILALYTGRTSEISTTLLLVAVLMVVYSYQILTSDVGFQLSFAATLGLIYISPLIEKYFLWVPEFFSLRESLLLTISAQITALPIILFNFNNLSVVSPVANILVAPFIPLAMFFGFLACLFSFLNFYLGFIFSFGAFLSLEIILKVTKYLANIPFASVEIPNYSFVLNVFYYCFLVFILFDKKRSLEKF